MAGDRGLLHPELPASALRDAAAELAERQAAGIASTSTCAATAPARSPCSRLTGAPYASFVLALERLTRA